MRRLQANLDYLSQLADRNERLRSRKRRSKDVDPPAAPDRPAILEPVDPLIPGNAMSAEGLNEIREGYVRLRETWPSKPTPAAKKPKEGPKGSAHVTISDVAVRKNGPINGAAKASPIGGTTLGKGAAKMPPPQMGTAAVG